jgi:tRNA/rRNA methyltransferase
MDFAAPVNAPGGPGLARAPKYAMALAMFETLAVVLCRPKFSENVGAAARACANMGCPNLILVAPRDYDPLRASALATGHGAAVLAAARVCETLPEALAGFEKTYGTTARVGGWRKATASPAQAAPEIALDLAEGGRVALVFGPEEAGLTNEETCLLGTLVTIPTESGASSLNLAQAVLLVLYEIFLASREAPAREPRARGPGPSRPATHAELETLFAAIREALTSIDFLKGDNPDYWMLPVRRFFSRFSLSRAEFNMLMGVCRQIKWIVSKFK